MSAGRMFQWLLTRLLGAHGCAALAARHRMELADLLVSMPKLLEWLGRQIVNRDLLLREPAVSKPRSNASAWLVVEMPVSVHAQRARKNRAQTVVPCVEAQCFETGS